MEIIDGKLKKLKPRKIIEYVFSQKNNDPQIDAYLLMLDKMRKELEVAKSENKVVTMKFLFDPFFRNCFGHEIICQVVKVFNSYVLICPVKDPFHGQLDFDKKICQCLLYIDAEKYLNEVIF